MRAFIAIELPERIKDFLSRIQGQLKSAGADVKWVEPQNIHLTLKFLGEINEERLVRSAQILEEITRGKNSFQIRLSSVGAFPKISSPRVVWVGIDKGDSETKEIARALEEAIEKIGISKEDRPFSSHITIGRARSSLNRDKLVVILNKLADNLGGESPEFTVTKIALFKSTLTPKGPIYEALKEAILTTT